MLDSEKKRLTPSEGAVTVSMHAEMSKHSRSFASSSHCTMTVSSRTWCASCELDYLLTNHTQRLLALAILCTSDTSTKPIYTHVLPCLQPTIASKCEGYVACKHACWSYELLLEWSHDLFTDALDRQRCIVLLLHRCQESWNLLLVLRIVCTTAGR